jgi:glucosamine kinase
VTVKVIIGIDGGGTGTRARLYTLQGDTLGVGETGPSSLSHGVAEAWVQIVRAVEQARQEAAHHAGLGALDWADCALGAGLAGANDAARAAQFAATQPGFAALALDTDGFTALLGAHAGRHGVMLISGTGSVAEAWGADGQRRSAGGWGFPIGDEGSGAWLGQQAVRHAHRVLDGRDAAGPLAGAVFAAIGDTAQATLAWCAQAGQTAYGSLAPLVFEHADRDAHAAAMIEGAANALAELARAVDPTSALPVACGGSVARRLQARLPAELRARCVEPAGDAMDGALHLVRRALAKGVP